MHHVRSERSSHRPLFLLNITVVGCFYDFKHGMYTMNFLVVKSRASVGNHGIQLVTPSHLCRFIWLWNALVLLSIIVLFLLALPDFLDLFKTALQEVDILMVI